MKALARWALHLDQAAQRAGAAKLQDPSEFPNGERKQLFLGSCRGFDKNRQDSAIMQM